MPGLFHFWSHGRNRLAAADRAYQQHHTACPQCRAAGTSPNTQQRCPEGAQLWGTYQQAGDPPHFTWLRKRFATYFLGHASRITC
jgi:hypothetical protein